MNHYWYCVLIFDIYCGIICYSFFLFWQNYWSFIITSWVLPAVQRQPRLTLWRKVKKILCKNYILYVHLLILSYLLINFELNRFSRSSVMNSITNTTFFCIYRFFKIIEIDQELICQITANFGFTRFIYKYNC